MAFEFELPQYRPPRLLRTAAMASSLFASAASAQALDAFPAPDPVEEAHAAAKRSADDLFEGFDIDDANPEAKVPTPAERDANPVQFGFYLMNLTEKAEEAYKRGEPAVAAKYYRAVVVAVPDAAVGFRKLCAAYELAGDRAKAEAACGAALLRNDALLDDYARYVRVVVAQREPLGEKQLKHVAEAVAFVRMKAPDKPVADQMECQLALRLKDERRLAECSSALQRRDAKDMSGISYAWLLAVMRLDRTAAAAALEQAKLAGADARAIEGMAAATENLRSPIEQFVHVNKLRLLTAFCALLLLSFVVRRYMLQLPPQVLGMARKSNVKLR